MIYCKYECGNRTIWAGCQTNIPCSSHKIRTTGSSMLLKTLLESANQRAYAQPRVFATEQVPAFRNFTAPYRTGFREGETVVFFKKNCGAIFKFGFASLSPNGHTGAASHKTCHQARQPSSDGCEPLYLEYSKIRAPGSGACVCCTRAHVARSRDASSQYGLLHGQTRRTLQTAGGGVGKRGGRASYPPNHCLPQSLRKQKHCLQSFQKASVICASM